MPRSNYATCLFPILKKTPFLIPPASHANPRDTDNTDYRTDFHKLSVLIRDKTQMTPRYSVLKPPHLLNKSICFHLLDLCEVKISICRAFSLILLYARL